VIRHRHAARSLHLTRPVQCRYPPVITQISAATDLHKPNVTGSEGVADVSKSVSSVARSWGENNSGPV
jgi:hypothetical protein